MSLLTLTTLALVLLAAFRDGWLGRALALGGATAAGAAITVGATSVPTFYAVSLAVPVALAAAVVQRSRHPERVGWPPGVLPMVLFLVWSTAVTVLAPFLLDGQLLVSPTADVLRAGVLTSSNVAQVVYLFLGVSVVVYLARSRSTTPRLVGLAAGLCTILSAWRYLGINAGLPFPEGLFDNSPSFAYIETAAGGLERFRGILSEPSGLAASSLVTAAYMLPRAWQVRGWHRVGCLALVVVAVFLGSVSTSTTFVVAGLASIGLIGGAQVLAVLTRRRSLSPLAAVLAIGTVVAVVWWGADALRSVRATLDDKLLTTSYAERSSANSDSLRVFLDTWGFGVGLGAGRASSFLPTLLSTTGVIGTILLTVGVVGLLLRAAPITRCRPVVWALVTLMVTKLAAGPDLSDSSGVFWISLGVLSHAVLEQRRHAAASSQASTRTDRHAAESVPPGTPSVRTSVVAEPSGGDQR